MRAIWDGTALAESDATIVIEGNHYFPPDSVRRERFVASPTHTRCPWKGEASYETIVVDGDENPDAAWFYPEPSDAAAEIRDYRAFWHGVTVTGD
ncbi:MAG: DUF427 domain-containing protein [Actinomycetota bacterium]|nr:DUF427 domain-containing protein [Actinomycetota bacterium]